jgi:Nuclease-related domain/TadE-like protein
VTTRVFDCGLAPGHLPERAAERRERGRQFLVALLSSLVLVPIAGAADPPTGWLTGALGALVVLGMCGLGGRRIGFGALLVALCLLALLLPHESLPAFGPAFFVAGAVVCILWFARREPARRSGRDRRDAIAEREAQQTMGRSGEQQVRATLASELPEAYVLFNGLTLPRAAGDLDHVVVGPSGVFLLETKTMAGHIVCEPDGTWRRTRVGRAGTAYGAYIGDPARQVQRNIHAVRQCLKRRLPHLFWNTPLWIEGIVVFPHPDTVLAAEHSRVPALKLEQIAQRIRSHRPRRPLQPQDVVDVTAALLQERVTGLRLARSAQAIVELALVMPVLVSLVFGVVALSRIVQAHSAIVGIAHEVARAGALGSSAEDALRRMDMRTAEVSTGLGLDRAALQVTPDISRFSGVDGQVAAIAHYMVDLSDLPLVGWAPPVQLRVVHTEWVDPFRAGVRRAADRGP